MKSALKWPSLSIVAIFVGLIAAYWFAFSAIKSPGNELPYDQFSQALAEGQIVEDASHPLNLLIEEDSSTCSLTGYRAVTAPLHGPGDKLRPFQTTISSDFKPDLLKQLDAANLHPQMVRPHYFGRALLAYMPILIFILMLCLLVSLIRWAIAFALRLLRPTARQ